jgi:hypothetical protein
MLPAASEADLRPASYQGVVYRPLLSTIAASLAALALGACSAAPSPSHVTNDYRGKLSDDILFEASTTVLVTRRDVVVALDCNAADERAIARGLAVRLPAHVTLYTPPFSPANPATAPTVVTDDKYAGTLCTPDSYDVVKS